MNLAGEFRDRVPGAEGASTHKLSGTRTVRVGNSGEQRVACNGTLTDGAR